MKAIRALKRLPNCASLKGGRLDTPDRPVALTEDIRRMWETARAVPAHTLRERYYKQRRLLCLALACYLAARRAEILGIDLAHVQREHQPWKVTFPVTKGGQPHWLPVHADLQSILEEWFPLREEWCEAYGHTSDALIPVDKVRRLGEAGLAEIVRDLAERAGVERRLTPHSFRHWAATTLGDTKGTRAAQSVLNHQSSRTTELYLHSNPQRVEAAINSLPSFSQAATPSAAAAPPVSDLYRQIL